jgi:hypothetical protein
MKATEFLRGVFSDDDGEPSFSRCATGVLVGFACFWITRIVVKNNVLPDFTGISCFITVLYGVNRAEGIGSAIASIFRATPAPQPPQQVGVIMQAQQPAPVIVPPNPLPPAVVLQP